MFSIMQAVRVLPTHEIGFVVAHVPPQTGKEWTVAVYVPGSGFSREERFDTPELAAV